jgi:hypothetical protein
MAFIIKRDGQGIPVSSVNILTIYFANRIAEMFQKQTNSYFNNFDNDDNEYKLIWDSSTNSWLLTGYGPIIATNLTSDSTTIPTSGWIYTTGSGVPIVIRPYSATAPDGSGPLPARSIIIKKNTTFKIPRTPPFLPSSLGGLALWLKADAGVSKFSFNYISQIIITGTSNPSFAGTYTATTVPTYDLEDGYVESYLLMGPEGKSMVWDSSVFVLGSSGEPEDSFSSTDGVNWNVAESYIYQIVISGFTGIYAGANGTYNGDGSYFTRVGGGFFINGNDLLEVEYETTIATAPADYSGSWTPTTYISSVTLTGANTTVVNGVYTRTDSQINESFITFFGSGGKNLYWNGDDWVAQSADEENAYYLSDFDLITWTVSEFTEGTAPAPTGATATSARSVGSPTSTSSSKPTGSISGSVTTTTVNTENVTEWADQSGNGQNATASASYCPTLVSTDAQLNNKPSLLFNGIGNSFVIPAINFTINTNNSIFVAFYISNGATSAFLTQGGAGNYFLGITDNVLNISNSNVDVIILAGAVSNGGKYIVSTTNDAYNFTLYKNGTQVGGPTYYDEFSEDGTEMLIGGDSNTVNNEQALNYFFNGKIAEIIIYNRPVTTPERQQVEAYLNSKYQIY